MSENRGENAPTNDRTEPYTETENDGHKGHIPSYGLARYLHDLDIEEFDLKTEQHRARCEGGRQ